MNTISFGCLTHPDNRTQAPVFSLHPQKAGASSYQPPDIPISASHSRRSGAATGANRQPSLLVVQDLRRSGLGPVSLSLTGGTCRCLTGPSGSGKSLLMRAIADLDPANGQVFLDGKPRENWSGADWRKLVRYLPAESGWWAETVGAHFIEYDLARAGAIRLGLPADCLDWPVVRLSTGEKQRLALLRALEDRPRVLLLDEPTAALDGNAIVCVETLLLEKLEEGHPGGVAALVVTHDKAQARRLARGADGPLMIRKGQLQEASEAARR